MGPALVVGLTGGLASGKSTVGALFEALGVPVIDADEVAREVVAPGAPALEAIRARFGDEVFAPDGGLDRPRLRAIVFADPDRRRALEAVLHPKVRATMRERLAALRAPYAILMVPLLLETGLDRMVDRVLVVDVPESLQMERAARRDGSARRTLEGILAAQIGRDERLRRADDVIRNDGDRDALDPQVQRLHQQYLGLAARLRVPEQQ